MLWALGTAARPEAVLELHSRQIDFHIGRIHLNPPEREQVAKKYLPVVRLPDALWETFRAGPSATMVIRSRASRRDYGAPAIGQE